MTLPVNHTAMMMEAKGKCKRPHIPGGRGVH